MIIKYCLTCGEQLEQNDDTCYQCPNGHPYYNNPRAGAAVVFLQDGKVLAARRGIEPGKGKYSFVGGFLQFGEDPRVAAQREAYEETGVNVTELELLDVFSHQYEKDESTVSIIFLAKRWEGTFKAADDAASVTWKPIDSIDSDQFAWKYPGLAAKLKALDNGQQASS